MVYSQACLQRFKFLFTFVKSLLKSKTNLKYRYRQKIAKYRGTGTTKVPTVTVPVPVADPENFGGGGFKTQNLKNLDVFTKIESDFSAEIGNSNVFFAQIQVVSKKKKKKKGLHHN